jgi:outer membrane receptor protein involved in Fe transport
MTTHDFLLRAQRSLFLLLVLLFCNAVSAQHTGYGNYSAANTGSGTGTLSGTIINSTTLKPVEYVYVVLNKAADSTLSAGGITDSLGNFKLEKIPYGKYYLAINLIGNKPQKISDIILTAENAVKKIDTIKLEPSSALLDAVEIKEKKNEVEFSLDKKVINVDKNLVSTGGTAVDVMQSIPSVTVDIDGNLSMRGSTNITVLVDGKPSGLTGISRSAILEQIPASSIESIEIISNPSAKYDPDGMSGIINIILKKKKERGYHGVFTVNAGTGDKYSGSVALNYSKGMFNVFANYDGRSNHSTGWGNMTRHTYFNDTDTTLMNYSTSSRKGVSHDIKLGTDIYLNAKNSLTLSCLYAISDDDHSDMTSSRKLDAYDVLTSYYQDRGSEVSSENSFDYALDYSKTFSKKGESLTADATYSTSHEIETGDQNVQYFYTDTITPLNSTPDKQHTISDDKNSVGTFQADYTYPLSKNSTLELGEKSILRSVDNDYQYNQFDYNANEFLNDTTLSNHFLYNEQIHAFYSTYSNTIGIFEFEAGLRAEQALTKSTLTNTNQEFNKDYFSLFPTLHLNLNLKKDNSIQLSYSRRVNRPGYWQMNPFVEIMSPGIYRSGNPYLTPEYIDSYELGHLKYWDKTSLNSSVFYKQINDAIQRIVTFDSSGNQYMTQQNISSGISYGLEFVVSQDFTKWWKATGTFSYFKTEMKGTTDGTELTNSNYSWTAKINSTMTLPKNFTIQLMGNYRAPMATIQGSMNAMYSADLAIKKEIFNKKANISLRLSDIFNTQKFDMQSSGNDFDLHSIRKRNSRVLYLGFTYKLNSLAKTKDKGKSFENNEDINSGDD